ncbi:MAG: hypothetical protein ACKVIG_15135 [Flavobacteriales bacterium]
MNGFNPLGGLKEWHLKLGCTLAIVGIIALIVTLIYAIIWLINHVQII